MTCVRAGSGPKSERAVDVQPCAVRFRELGDPAQIVERAGVHIPGLRAYDQRTRPAGSHYAVECFSIHRSILPSRNHFDDVFAETEKPE